MIRQTWEMKWCSLSFNWVALAVDILWEVHFLGNPERAFACLYICHIYLCMSMFAWDIYNKPNIFTSWCCMQSRKRTRWCLDSFRRGFSAEDRLRLIGKMTEETYIQRISYQGSLNWPLNSSASDSSATVSGPGETEHFLSLSKCSFVEGMLGHKSKEKEHVS